MGEQKFPGLRKPKALFQRNYPGHKRSSKSNNYYDLIRNQ